MRSKVLSNVLGGLLFAIMSIHGLAKATDTDCAKLLGGPSREDLINHLTELKADSGGTANLLHESADELDHESLGPVGQKILNRLNQLVVGHHEAKITLAKAVQRAATKTKDPKKTVGNYIFLGPTGLGKSLLAKALAEALNGDPNALVAVDCGEMQSDHETSKITGAPPGYIGYDDVGKITNENLEKYTNKEYNVNVVLIDEVEKASGNLYNLLLGVMENGTMSNGKSETIDFRKSIVIMTSNLGQAEMQQLMNEQKNPMGFAVHRTKEEDKDEEIESTALRAAKLGLPAEFFNRIDKAIVFKRYTKEEAYQVLNMNIEFAQKKPFMNDPEDQILFTVTPEAKQFIYNAGYESEYGGRSLRRVISHLLTDPLTNLKATEKIRHGDLVEVSLNEGRSGLVFKKLASDLSESERQSVYLKIYGHEFVAPPAVETKKELLKADRVTSSMPKKLARFLKRLHQEEDNHTRLLLIWEYLEQAPQITDLEFLYLLSRAPNDWTLGFENSDLLVNKMKELGFGSWQNLEFEPVILSVYWYGLSKIQSIAKKNKQLVGGTFAGLSHFTGLWLKSQTKLPQGFKSDLVNFLNKVYEDAMQLPEK